MRETVRWSKSERERERVRVREGESEREKRKSGKIILQAHSFCEWATFAFVLIFTISDL